MAPNQALVMILSLALAVGTAAGCDSQSGGSQGAQEAPAQAPAQPRARRKLPAPKAPPQPENVTTQPTPSASAMSTPEPVSFLKRNLEFDARRIEGITQVYDGSPKKALATFNDALKLKPNDPSIRLWLDAIKEAERKARHDRADQAPGASTPFWQPQPAKHFQPEPAAPSKPKPARQAPIKIDPRQLS